MSGNYIHGYDSREQQRLEAQARFLENKIYAHIDFSPGSRILEPGCGTGAQIEILLRRFPDCSFTGIDLSESQLAVARRRLAEPIASGQVELFQMDALNLAFPPERKFDGAFLCWMLEHVSFPVPILTSVRRVLRPGAILHVTEVQNSTFFMLPPQPATSEYWAKYNALQSELGGDPFVGVKLGNILAAAGFLDVQVHPRSFHYDNRTPRERQQMFAYWRDLLSSALPGLTGKGWVQSGDWEAVANEMNAAAEKEGAVFFYTFFQGRAVAPALWQKDEPQG
jgi:ubiquinone/menaquinone biosynthesis C-methylase UbiE